MRILLFALLLMSQVFSFAQTIFFAKQSNNFDSLLKQRRKEVIGKPFPSFYASVDNVLLNNESLKGKVVFINFWFEACAPCMAEFDALNELYLKLKDNKNLEFISFTYETVDKVKEIKNKFHIKYKIAS